MCVDLDLFILNLFIFQYFKMLSLRNDNQLFYDNCGIVFMQGELIYFVEILIDKLLSLLVDQYI